MVENNGVINIGTNTAARQNGIQNEATFNNNSGAQINIDFVANTGLFNLPGGNFTNVGTITIGATIGGDNGLENQGLFTNEGGTISVSNTLNAGLYLYNGSFFNFSGTIQVAPAGNAIPIGISLAYGSFLNQGQVNIYRAGTGIFSSNQPFNNFGSVTIDLTSPFYYLVNAYSPNVTAFKNGGDFKGTGVVAPGSFLHNGGSLSPGNSPGKIIFVGNQNFAKSTLLMKVNGVGTAGINYDQVTVQGTATLQGVINLSVNTIPADGSEVVLVSANGIQGQFANVQGLPPNWRIKYTPTSVLLIYDLSNAWTGAADNNWHNQNNWSQGQVPGMETNVRIPAVNITPHINMVGGAVARTVLIEPGGRLNINSNLTTYGVKTFNGVAASFFNQGWVMVFGSLTIFR
jgi:hypothetical protein